MGEELRMNLTSVALLVVDYQQGVVETMGTDQALAAVNEATALARSCGLPVVFVRTGFCSEYSDVSRNNKMFARFADGDLPMTADATATQLHTSVQVMPSDVVLVKNRVSAFTGSGLDILLRSRSIDTLAIAGISTSGCVLSTIREASDRDYRLFVLGDACTDPAAAVHDTLLNEIFPAQAEVVASADWIEAL
jgi:nicotinamidase-related amidase